jgi:hypothetical protein
MERALLLKNAVRLRRLASVRVILVVGAQKIVPDVAAGMRPIYEYCYPLEDSRARRVGGVPSGVNNSHHQ